MKTNYEIRYAAHPEDAKSYDTTRIRRDFLIEKIFVPNEVNKLLCAKASEHLAYDGFNEVVALFKDIDSYIV